MKKYADVAIHRAATRSKLPARHDPYWRSLGGGSLGYRKTDSGVETWIARWRSDEKKYHFNKLGNLATMDFAQAKKAAEAWFKTCEYGTVRAGTVREACEAYVQNIGQEKGERARKYAEWPLSATVYEHKIGGKPLDKITPADVEAWRNDLVDGTRQKNSANRIFRTFKAALNYAYRQGMVGTDRAWKVVQQFRVPDGQRDIYLTAKQRKELIAHCTPELADLLTGLYLTGARPTELTTATVNDLDLRSRTLTLTTQKGGKGARSRDVHLLPAAVEFFKELKKRNRDYLFVQEDGQPWPKHQYTRALNEALSKTDLPTGIVAYTLRHTAISDWLQAGVDIATVAKLAGTSVAMIDKNYHKFIRSNVDDKLANIAF